MVKFHEWTAWVILVLCAVQIALTALALRSGSATWWLLIGGVLVIVAEILQAGTGYARYLRVHVPLGVIIFGAVLLQTISVFRRSEGSPG